MSLFGIAWRNIRQRLLTSALTALSLGLGVALVVATLVTAGVVEKVFASGSGLGYNIIVGAKGSPLQLVLNSVYLISKPIENVSWAFYREFLPAAERGDGVDGRYAGGVQTAVPICMGDYFRGHRVVGTSAAYFDRLEAGDGRPFRFAAGRNFRDDEWFSGVLGAGVAASLGLKVGDRFSPTHAADDGPQHDPFTVVGILARTGTPVDRGVYVNMEGFYLQEGHAKPVAAGAADGAGAADAAQPAEPATDRPRRLPDAQREVTAILLDTPDWIALGLRTAINEGTDGQAAMPILEIRQLLDVFVKPLKLFLLLVTALVVVVAAIGILVSMVGSSLERSRDVAIMRALGAHRGHVLATVLLEAVILALAGGLGGWVLGHLIVGAIGPLITSGVGASAGVLSAAPLAELLLVPLLVILAIAAALLPALAAYRTDVSRWL